MRTSYSGVTITLGTTEIYGAGWYFTGPLGFSTDFGMQVTKLVDNGAFIEEIGGENGSASLEFCKDFQTMEEALSAFSALRDAVKAEGAAPLVASLGEPPVAATGWVEGVEHTPGGSGVYINGTEVSWDGGGTPSDFAEAINDGDFDVTAAAEGGRVILTAKTPGEQGNSITLETTGYATISGEHLTGGYPGINPVTLASLAAVGGMTYSLEPVRMGADTAIRLTISYSILTVWQQN